MSSFTWSRSRFLSPNVTLTITARRKLKRSLSWATTLYNTTLTNFENVLATSQISTSVDPRTPWGSSFCLRSWLTIQTKFQLRINRVLIRLCLSKMPKSSVKASSRMLISILFNNILFVVWRWIKKFSQRWEMPEFVTFLRFGLNNEPTCETTTSIFLSTFVFVSKTWTKRVKNAKVLCYEKKMLKFELFISPWSMSTKWNILMLKLRTASSLLDGKIWDIMYVAIKAV